MEQWPVLKFFKYDHLPAHLQPISKPYFDLAHALVDDEANHQHPSEIYRALEKLLEAKDCAVRGYLKF